MSDNLPYPSMPEEPVIKVYPPDYKKVPGSGRMAEAVKNYIEHGFQPGHFLTSVVCNDLQGAFSHADSENAALMHDWIKFFYNEIQSNAWGSPKVMNDWMDHFDVDGNIEKLK